MFFKTTLHILPYTWAQKGKKHDTAQWLGQYAVDHHSL